jgi:transmembrane 9 superfamily protein 2/4
MVGPRAGLQCLASLLLLSPADAFYIPGWSIKSYKDNERLPLLVNKVYSDNTQLQYAYYDLPFVCPPTGQTNAGGLLSGQSISLNLGEVLRGDRIMASDIDVKMNQGKTCRLLCNKELSRSDLERARDIVADGYVAEWIVDNLPGATSFVTADKARKYYASGFKLGYTRLASRTGKLHAYLNNHVTIVLRYRAAPGRAGERGEKVIVGFEIYPKSIGPDEARDDHGCPVDLEKIEQPYELTMQHNQTQATLLAAGKLEGPAEPDVDDITANSIDDEDASVVIPFTYSIYFREDETIEWAHRWDLYFVNQEDGSHIHWLAIINSLVICAVLTAIVTIILAKTIRADIKGRKESLEAGKPRSRQEKASTGLLGQDSHGDYDDDDDDDDEPLEDVTGWKLLHADVFRTPAHGAFLAPLVGSGVQLLFMAAGLVLFSAFGVLNPSYRGGFLNFAFGLFVGAGLLSGTSSVRIYKSFGGQDYRRNAFITALLFPGLLFSFVFMLNLFVWAQASSTAIPFTTLLVLALLWLCVQVPLVYVGSQYGLWRSAGWEHPTRASATPRHIPQQMWYAKPLQSVLLAGLVPFVVIFIELLYVLQSVWQDKSGYYYLFGFLAVISIILAVTVAEVTVVSTYLQLCAENHHWWWHSFFVGGASSVWIMAYCAWYYVFKLHITGFVSGLLFFAYSFMACCMYGLLTGTIGFLSAYAFVRRIYGAIKID